MGWGTVATIGLNLYNGYQARKAAGRAGDIALEVADKNADIIARDKDTAERQIELLRNNLEISNRRKSDVFSAVQGSVRNKSLGGGVTSRGTPQDIMRFNAREFDYELAIDDYNTQVEILEQQDVIEETKLREEVTRMGGVAEKQAYRASGNKALLQGLGTGLEIADDAGYLG